MGKPTGQNLLKGTHVSWFLPRGLHYVTQQNSNYELYRYGGCRGFHKWGLPPIAGWFISWKLLSIAGWWLGVPAFQETSRPWILWCMDRFKDGSPTIEMHQVRRSEVLTITFNIWCLTSHSHLMCLEAGTFLSFLLGLSWLVWCRACLDNSFHRFHSSFIYSDVIKSRLALLKTNVGDFTVVKRLG